jgi:hypothetical protein
VYFLKVPLALPYPNDQNPLKNQSSIHYIFLSPSTGTVAGLAVRQLTTFEILEHPALFSGIQSTLPKTKIENVSGNPRAFRLVFKDPNNDSKNTIWKFSGIPPCFQESKRRFQKYTLQILEHSALSSSSLQILGHSAFKVWPHRCGPQGPQSLSR